jgi:ParB-like chromosome segregation protein Spo0J
MIDRKTQRLTKQREETLRIVDQRSKVNKGTLVEVLGAEPGSAVKLRPVKWVSPLLLTENPDNPFSPHVEFDRLVEDVKERGVLVPVIARKDGHVLAGNNRLRAALQAELAEIPVQYLDAELDPEAERRLVLTDNLLRRNLTPAERVAFLAALYPAYFEREAMAGRPSKIPHGAVFLSPEEIARETGLSVDTVQRDRKTYQTAKAKTEDKAAPPSPKLIAETRQEENTERKNRTTQPAKVKAAPKFEPVTAKPSKVPIRVRTVLESLRSFYAAADPDEKKAIRTALDELRSVLK